MAEESASGEVSAGRSKIGFSERADTALVFLILVLLFVSAGQAFMRWAGNRYGWAGLTSFGGGQPASGNQPAFYSAGG